jgi:hypothetical protein
MTMSVSSIRRYSAKDSKPDGRGQYVLIKDIKQYLPEDMQMLDEESEVYTYLMDNKCDEVIALKKEFDAQRTEIIKPRKFNVTVTVAVDSFSGVDFDWHRNRGTAFFSDDSLADAYEKIEKMQEEIDDELTKLIKPYKAKLKKLYSDVKPKVVLEDEDLSALAYHVFEYNFDVKTGEKLIMYPTKNKSKRSK